MKTYTDLQQSKKLAEILPLESADMVLPFTHTENGKYIPGYVISRKYVEVYNEMIKLIGMDKEEVHKLIQPIWSFAALLDVLPKGEYKDTDLCVGGYKGDKYIPEWFCSYEQQEPLIIEICHAPNPVDACYEMILKLHEQKLL